MSGVSDDDLFETSSEADVADDAAESEYWLRLQAGLYTTAVESGVEATGADTGTGARAEAVNSRVKGWAYRIPRHKFDLMTRQKSELLQPAE